jgi:hypothetical protein
MDVLAPLLPSQIRAPSTRSAPGCKAYYLTRLPEALAAALIDLIGAEARDIIRGNLLLEGAPSPAIGLLEWEEHEMQEVRNDTHIPETEREAIVLARRGQGAFKANVMRIERACRITGVTRESICGPATASRGGTRATRSALMERMACSSRPMPTISSIAVSSASRTTGMSSYRPWPMPRHSSRWEFR